MKDAINSFGNATSVLMSLTLMCSLAACGGSDSASSDTVNIAPTVEAGVDQTVNEETLVNLSGTASDSDGTVTSYLWQQNSGLKLLLLLEFEIQLI